MCACVTSDTGDAKIPKLSSLLCLAKVAYLLDKRTEWHTHIMLGAIRVRKVKTSDYI